MEVADHGQTIDTPVSTTDAPLTASPYGATQGPRPPGPRPLKKSGISTTTYIAIAAVIIVVVSGVAYAVVTSQAPGNPCAGSPPSNWEPTRPRGMYRET